MKPPKGRKPLNKLTPEISRALLAISKELPMMAKKIPTSVTIMGKEIIAKGITHLPNSAGQISKGTKIEPDKIYLRETETYHDHYAQLRNWYAQYGWPGAEKYRTEITTLHSKLLEEKSKPKPKGEDNPATEAAVNS